MRRRESSQRARSSRRVMELRQWFGISSALPAWDGGPGPQALPAVRRGQIMLITGASGSGKSRLLARLRRKLRRRWIDLRRVRLPRRAVADLFCPASTPKALQQLSRVGLAEAHCFVARPRQLSVGQRWRLRLAVALEQLRRMKRGATLLCDEFAAPLDRVTAAIVCRLLRRQVTRLRVAAVVASARADLVSSLQPDIVVECDFGCVRIDRNRTACEGV